MQSGLSLYWLEQFNIPIPSNDQLGNLSRFLAMLTEWNRRFNLTAAKDRDTLVRRHLMDSLTPLVRHDLLADGVLDIGSGGGFPGIPLAICMPATQFILVERVARKCAFLRAVRRELKLDHVTVLQADLVEVKPRWVIHTAITRAVRVDVPFLDQLKRLGVHHLVTFETTLDSHTVLQYRLPEEDRQRYLSVIPLRD